MKKTDTVDGKIYFSEVQQFRVAWLWAIIILSVLSSVGLMLGVIIAEKGNDAEVWVVACIIVPMEAIMLYLFYMARLETVISSEGVYYRWWPFHRKHRFIARKEIESTEIKKGPSLNVGYHRLPGYGKVHNVAPGEGVQFILRTGEKLFLGTGATVSMQTALERIMTVSHKA